MSLTVPLAVKLNGVDVSDRLGDVSFRSTSPFGFSDATIELHAISDRQPAEVARFLPLEIQDGRNARTCWEGLQEDPARASGGGDGRTWNVAATGGGVHMKDSTKPLIYVDRDLTAFTRADNFTPGGSDAVTNDPGDDTRTSIVLRIPQGTSVVTNSRVVVRYLRLLLTGQKLARFDYTTDSGVTITDWNVEGYTRVNGGATGEAARSETWTTAGRASSPRVVVTNFPNGRNTLDLRIIYTPAVGGPVNADTAWSSFRDVAVRALLLDKTGTEITTGYTADTVLASEVVADLLGRMCPRFDRANARIDVTTYAINQLARLEGATPFDVAQDLLAFEPGFTWHVWERQPNGLWRFEWVAWPTTTVRYECDDTDGLDSPSSAAELYDAVTVAYYDSSGKPQTVTATQSIPEMTAAGISRAGYIRLDEKLGSTANAQRVAAQFLAEHATPPNRGRLTIRRPIQDMVTGRRVMPWEIRPGNLIRVRGVQPRADALNVNGRNGKTVFRVVSTEYTASTNTCVLELDSFARTTTKFLTDVQTRRR